MNEIINHHDFEEAKNELLEFSKQTNEKTTLSKVAVDGGLFNLGDHKVTGLEFNTLVTQVQKITNGSNDNFLKVVDEIGAVYKALESLDKEYIAGILTGVKSAEEASSEAVKASNQAKKALDRIDEMVETHENIIKVLKSHKEKLEELKHLENIDELWESQKETEKTVTEIRQSIETNQITNKNYFNNIENSISLFDKNNNSKFKRIKKILICLTIGLGITFAIATVTFTLLKV